MFPTTMMIALVLFCWTMAVRGQQQSVFLPVEQHDALMNVYNDLGTEECKTRMIASLHHLRFQVVPRLCARDSDELSHVLVLCSSVLVEMLFHCEIAS